MKQGSLLDSHSLLWLGNKLPLRAEALARIGRDASQKLLFTSHISIWEMGVAVARKRIHLRPNLGDRLPAKWFWETTAFAAATPLPISAAIAAEAALVPTISGYGDPGDCFLIATARIHNLTLVTRDTRILALAETQRDYLSALAC